MVEPSNKGVIGSFASFMSDYNRIEQSSQRFCEKAEQQSIGSGLFFQDSRLEDAPRTASKIKGSDENKDLKLQRQGRRQTTFDMKEEPYFFDWDLRTNRKRDEKSFAKSTMRQKKLEAMRDNWLNKNKFTEKRRYDK